METHQINPKYSIIIPAYNAQKTIGDCLASLTAQIDDHLIHEIIVVDDGSTDETAKIVKQFKVNYIHQSNRGPATARNAGAKAAQGEIILFTDSDCIPTENWLHEMVKPFNDPNVMAVKGAYLTRQKSIAARFAQVEFEDRYDLLETFEAIDMVDTYSAAFRRAIFLEMGGFDENFPVANNEDTDLSYRMVSAGYKMVFNRKALVYHTHPATLKKYLRIKFWRGYWRLIVYKRYPAKAVKDTYTPMVIKLQTLLMSFSMACLGISLVLPSALYMVLGIWIVILFSAVPFAKKAWRHDPLIGFVSPMIIWARAGAFALGSVLGGIRSLGFDKSGSKA